MKNILLSLLALALAFLTACSGLIAPSRPLEITLEAAGMHYQPSTFEVTAGEPVRLMLRNSDSVDHDFSIMEIPLMSMGGTAEPMAGHKMGDVAVAPQLHMAATMNTSNSIEFTPTKAGTYEFFCTVPGHKEAGMVGTMIVRSR